MAIYHRRATDTPNQNLTTMVRQVHSSEIWGLAHKQNGAYPAVKAYLGCLPDGIDGVEFETNVPSSSGATFEGAAHLWYAVTGHAQLHPNDPDMAVLRVTIRRVRYMGPIGLRNGVDTPLP